MDVSLGSKYFGVGILIAITAVGGVFCYRNLSKLTQNQSWVENTSDVLAEIEEVGVGVAEAGSATRRFLTSGAEEDAVTSNTAMTDVQGRADRLLKLTEDNPAQEKRALDLRKRLSVLSDVLKSVIEKRRSGDLSDSDKTLKESLKNREEIRQAIAKLSADERSLLPARNRELDKSDVIAKGGLIVATSLSLCFLVIYAVVSRREVVRSRELLESRTRLASLVDSSEDAIIAKNIDGTIAGWNNGAERLYGYSAHEIIGKSVSLLALPGQIDDIADTMERIRGGQRVEAHEVERITKDGRRLTVSITVSPIWDAKGTVTGAATIARDVTLQRRMEAKLRQAHKMEALGRLSAGVAHDFNNILCVINASHDILQKSQSDSSLVEECLDNIQDSSKRGEALTRQLLAFSRQRVPLETIIELSAHVKQLSKLVKVLIGEDIELEVVSKTESAFVEVDPSNIDQLILNLAVNAREAMTKGGKLSITLGISELDDVYVDGLMHVIPGKYVVLSVSDTGCGMNEVTVSQIFDPFFTTKESGKGTGLGLSTVHSIVTERGGCLRVYSEPDHGSTFKVYLPLISAGEGTADDPATAVLERREGPAIIVLVEDDLKLRRLTRYLLQEHGYTVVEAEDGKDAVAWCAAHAGQCDLVLTDMIMPGMSGTEVAEKVQCSDPQARVVFMSGFAGDSLANIVSHGDAFLEKPFTRARLLKTVHDALSESRSPTTQDSLQGADDECQLNRYDARRSRLPDDGSRCA